MSPSLPPLGGRTDVRGQSPQQFTTRVRVVEVPQDVRAVIRFGPVTQHRGLNVVKLNGDGTAPEPPAWTIR